MDIINFLKTLKTPTSLCKNNKGLISQNNKVIGAYLYDSRGVSNRNIVVGAYIAMPRNSSLS